MKTVVVYSLGAKGNLRSSKSFFINRVLGEKVLLTPLCQNSGYQNITIAACNNWSFNGVILDKAAFKEKFTEWQKLPQSECYPIVITYPRELSSIGNDFTFIEIHTNVGFKEIAATADVVVYVPHQYNSCDSVFVSAGLNIARNVAKKLLVYVPVMDTETMTTADVNHYKDNIRDEYKNIEVSKVLTAFDSPNDLIDALLD